MGQRILAITDGLSRIDLLSEAHLSVVEWRPKRPEVQSTFRESPVGDGRQPSSWRFSGTSETLEMNGAAQTQDDLIELFQDLHRLLIKGLNYHTVNWQSRPVWIERKASNETNTSYALITLFQPLDDDFPYRDPVRPKGGLKPASTDAGLIIERGYWCALPPGQGECVEISSIHPWKYQLGWSQVFTGSSSPLYVMMEMADTSKVKVAGAYTVSSLTIVESSSDSGLSYVSGSSLPSGFGNAFSMLELANGYIIVGSLAGKVSRSTDSGTSYAAATTLDTGAQIQGLCQDGSGIVYAAGYDPVAGGNGGIWKSSDNGGSWSLTAGLDNASDVKAIGDTIYIQTDRFLFKSTDQGATVTPIAGVLINNEANLFVKDEALYGFSKIYGGGYYNVTLYKLVDDILTPVGVVRRAVALPSVYKPFSRDETIFVGVLESSDSYLYKSLDGGLTWSIERSNGSGEQYWHGVVHESGMYSSIQFDDLSINQQSILDLGAEDDCSGAVFIGNQQTDNNLTNVLVFDDSAATYTAAFPITSFPTELLPNPLGANDIVYFGATRTLPDPFSSLVLDLGTPFSYSGTATLTWQYWNGSTWASLTVKDGTKVSANTALTNVGVCSVHWEPPSNWTLKAVDGVTGWWVRLLVSSTGTTVLSIPAQQNRDVYTIANNWIEVDESDIGGDIPALARFKLRNRSDFDGGTTAPKLYSNRLICGLRSLTRRGVDCSDFRSLINFSDRQVPFGLTISGSSSAKTSAPTGRYMSLTTSSTSYVTAVTVTFSNSLVRQYHGEYHMYLIGYQVNGAAGEVLIRVKITSGSGGVTTTTRPRVFKQVTDDFELLDFDAISFPTIGVLAGEEIGDQATITIEGKTTDGNSHIINFYALVMVPTDEWFGDFTDKANIAGSVIGQLNGLERLIDIDSLSLPKKLGRSVVKQADVNESVVSVYEFAPNGEVILQANASQRLHVLSAAYGTSSAWITKPQVAWSVQAFKNQRYLSGRGSR